MRQIFVAAAVIAFSAGGALAQSPTPADPGQRPPAESIATAPGAPVAGANSFTEGQARSRIEAAGYADVSKLTKDKDGVWRGKATKSGTPYDVSLDYQGNVSPK